MPKFIDTASNPFTQAKFLVPSEVEAQPPLTTVVQPPKTSNSSTVTRNPNSATINIGCPLKRRLLFVKNNVLLHVITDGPSSNQLQLARDVARKIEAKIEAVLPKNENTDSLDE